MGQETSSLCLSLLRRKEQNDMELLACIVFFVLGFVIGNALPYTMLVGDWKCAHGTTVTPSDDELYKWHYKRMIKKTRKRLRNENRNQN